MKLKEKNRVIGVGLWVLILLAIIPVTALAVPGAINYQGYLTDEHGNASNGNVAITFRIWNAQLAGTALWSESHASVMVTEGIFNVILGSSVPIGAGILDGDRYLGITVGTDSEMTPRMKVTSVAYAIRAGYAENVATGLCVNATGGTMTGRLGVTVHSIGSTWSEAVKGELSGSSPGAGVYGLAHAETASGVYGGATGNSGKGVVGEVSGISGKGVYGYANDSTGTNFGVHGKTNSPNGYGGYFEGRGYFSGNVGIGTNDPQTNFHVVGYSRFDVPGGGRILITTPGSYPGFIAYSPNGHRRDIVFRNGGIDLDVSKDGNLPSAGSGIQISEEGRLTTKVLSITGGSGPVAATFRGNVQIQSRNTGQTIIEMGEGLDYAEGFHVSDKEKVTPGSVLSIDSDNPGKLRLSAMPYDIRVAGIAAGAMGLGSAVRLGVGQFDHDVALAGRVYCNVDSTYGEIKPGDLLTTSPTPGYAMVVKDHTKAQGAILGKAMDRLAQGHKSQLLVLVTLQ